MLAGVRSRFLLSISLTFSVGAWLPVHAQVNGVPPSVTSIGFGGRFINGVPPSVTSIGFGGNSINGVRPSVTSLGKNGSGNSWPAFGNCCANLFLPANPNPPLFSGRHHDRNKNKDKDRTAFPVGIFEPAYIPYPVPYAEEADDDSPDVDHFDPAGQQNAGPPKRGVPASRVPDSDKTEEELVIAQPSTVLVFKDGHKADVLNYAIVGDTLFDFADGRSRKILLADLDLPATHKANDDRGVDFQIPIPLSTANSNPH